MAWVIDLTLPAGVFRAKRIWGSAPLGCNSANQGAFSWHGHRRSRLYRDTALAHIGKYDFNFSAPKYSRRKRHLERMPQIGAAVRQRLHLVV